MSTAGQVVGGLVGAVAGFFIGGGPTGALYGAQIGIMAGGYLDPPKGPTQNGPRLNDLSVQTSTYGAVIPRVYGTVTVNGNVFWLENNQIKETVTKKKSGGKGGGSKTTTRTYTYSATFAVGLCKGPIAGVRRIWIGPDLIYDAGSADANTIAASNAAASEFTVYNGTDTQSANSRMQATLGAANTPAWRGLAYIVFYDLSLSRYGNSLMGAQVRCEVLMTSTATANAVAITLPSSIAWGNMASSPTAVIAVVDGSATSTSYGRSTDGGQTWASLSVTNSDLYGIAYGAGVFVAIRSYFNSLISADDGLSFSVIASMPFNGSSWLSVCFGNGVFVVMPSAGTVCCTSPDGNTWTAGTVVSRQWVAVQRGGSIFCAIAKSTNISATSSDGRTWTEHATMPSSTAWEDMCWNGSVFVAVGAAGVGASSPDGITWTAITLPGGLGYFEVEALGAFLVATAAGSTYAAYSNDNGATWTQFNLPSAQDWKALIASNGYFIAAGRSSTAGAKITLGLLGSTQTLSAIVSAECLQSGILSSGDIDVTALASTNVRGYRIGSVGAIRAAIEPLQASWPFDVVQHGYKIQYVMRGGSSVVTIPAADLDARTGGQQSGVQITTSREMDSQLSRRVTVQHLDYDREYNAGTQYAERLNTAAINAQILDLPIVLTATEAAGKAEVLLYLYWLERYDVAVNLPPTYNQLEPGDVVTLVTPEGNVQLRLVGINYTSDGRVEARAKYANPAIYTPTAVGASPPISGPVTITPVGASVYVLMDLPHMSSAQDGPSFLSAMTGALSGWRGGVLMQSTDSGSTWANLHDFGSPGTTLGTCSNSIGSVEHRVIDNASLLTVTLTQGELYSITQLQMLGGANHFAYGVDGRWEIIAAQTCTLVSGTTYTLSNLLRGRFGTEQFMGSHANGDSLVLLDTTDVAAIVMGAGTIGLSYLYRGITVDRDISTDSNRAFTYAGVNLKPLSPIALTGNRDASNDWAMTWVRRTRDGGEWRDNVDASLGESSEAYQIDVFSDGTYTTVKRTISATSASAAYTSADQTTDFGGNQGTLYLKIYQMSATVGRGYPLTQSITR